MSSTQNDQLRVTLVLWRYHRTKSKITIVSGIYANKVFLSSGKIVLQNVLEPECLYSIHCKVRFTSDLFLVIDLKERVEVLEKDRQEQSRTHSREIARIARMVENSSSHRILQMNNRLVEEQILRWSESLSSARVTRWGGVISTPGKSTVIRAIVNMI